MKKYLIAAVIVVSFAAPLSQSSSMWLSTTRATNA